MLPIRIIWLHSKIFILKVLFLMKQFKHHKGFNYYTKYKSSFLNKN